MSSWLCFLYEIWSILLKHLFLNAWNLLSVLASSPHFTSVSPDWYYEKLKSNCKPDFMVAPDLVHLAIAAVADAILMPISVVELPLLE